MEKLSVPKRDNLHLTTSKGDSYNVLDNFYITSRGMGKSDILWSKVYNQYKKYRRTAIIIRTIQADITCSYLDDIETILNKFRDPEDYCTITYMKGSIKDGVVDIHIKEKGCDDEKHGDFLARIVALSIKVTRFKSLMVRNPSGVFYDEFIPNTRLGEKWLDGCAWRVKELYSTFAREAQGYMLKRYWFGNPYSRYNPYLLEYYNIDTLKLTPGAFLHGDNYIVDLQTPKPELVDLLKKQNPDLLNDIDTEWLTFMNGEFVNDENFIVQSEQPQGYSLRWIFRISNHYIGCFRTGDPNNMDGDFECDWWVRIMDDWKGARRDVYAANFDNLVQGTKLISTRDRTNAQILKNAIASRRIAFQDINSAYLLQSIYTLL